MRAPTWIHLCPVGAHTWDHPSTWDLENRRPSTWGIIIPYHSFEFPCPDHDGLPYSEGPPQPGQFQFLYPVEPGEGDQA
jgi:hypothetical protein